MTEEVQEQQPAEAEYSELESLKARADLLGIKYHPATGVDKLRAKISNAMGEKPSSLDNDPDVPRLQKQRVDALTEKEFHDEEFKLRKSNAGRLIRVRVTCMNPIKKEWDGEIISVGSAKIGTYKKFVKFNAEDGWHIPHIIYEYLKERKFSSFYYVTNQLGQKVRKSKLVPEFGIEILPELTKEELRALAQRQAMAAGKDE